jgi:hypothetical protein
MSFSRKQYMAIAKTLAASPVISRAAVVKVLSEMFAKDNPAFKPGQFAEACAFNGVGADDPMRDADERRAFADAEGERRPSRLQRQRARRQRAEALHGGRGVDPDKWEV